jgi:hypothetical protein
MKTITFIICFHTWPWTKYCLESLNLEDVVVVNNNPIEGSKIVDWYIGPQDRSHNKFCKAESEFLKDIGVKVIQPEDRPLKHGQAMDYARDWFISQGYDIMVHIEPDCVASGNEWRDNLVNAIKGGCWMASGFRDHRGYLRPCPSAWDLQNTKHLSFSFSSRPDGKKWDTGLKAWYECNLLGKDKYVETHDLTHYGGGSWRNRHPSHPIVYYL